MLDIHIAVEDMNTELAHGMSTKIICGQTTSLPVEDMNTELVMGDDFPSFQFYFPI